MDFALGAENQTDVIRLRSLQENLEVSWTIDGENLIITSKFYAFGYLWTKPYINLQIGVLNVMGSDTLQQFDSDLDGSLYEEAPDGGWFSDAIQLNNMEEDPHKRTEELGIVNISSSHYNNRRYHYHEQWTVNFSKLRGGDGGQYDGDEPQRLFIIRGSVHFQDQNFNTEE
jgi:hypothetical protein